MAQGNKSVDSEPENNARTTHNGYNYTMYVIPFRAVRDPRGHALECQLECDPVSMDVQIEINEHNDSRVIEVIEQTHANSSNECTVPLRKIMLSGRSDEFLMNFYTESYSQVELLLTDGAIIRGTFACHIEEERHNHSNEHSSWISIHTSRIDSFSPRNTKSPQLKLCPLVHQSPECNNDEMVVKITRKSNPLPQTLFAH
jgi:hypothetical protein